MSAKFYAIAGNVYRQLPGERASSEYALCSFPADAVALADRLTRSYTYLYQVWNAGNDTNGNSRRVTLVFAYDGATVAALDQGSSGDRIPRDAITLPSVNCTVAEYREACRGEELREAARRWLDAGYSTRIEDIGREAQRNGAESNLRRFVREVRGKWAQWDALRSAIWSVETHRDLGYAWVPTAKEVR